MTIPVLLCLAPFQLIVRAIRIGAEWWDDQFDDMADAIDEWAREDI